MLTDDYNRDVLPALAQNPNAAFPEFGWQRRGGRWVATNGDYTRATFGARADRVQLYDNTPYGFVVHGDGFKTWQDYTGLSYKETAQALAARLGLAVYEAAPVHDLAPVHVAATVQAPVPPPPEAPAWSRLTDASTYRDRCRDRSGAKAAWDQYKALPLDWFTFYELGLGALPPRSSRCRAERLIVPWVVGGEVVAFRGRAPGPCQCSPEIGPCAHWMHTTSTAPTGGALLWNGAALLPDYSDGEAARYGLCRSIRPWQENQTLVLMENSIDTALFDAPGAVALAPMCGAGAWVNETWVRLIVQSRPRAVVVWLDYDQAGNAPATVRYQARYNERGGVHGLYPYLAPREAEVARLVAHRASQRPDLPVAAAYSDPLLSAGAKLFALLVEAFWQAGTLSEKGVPPVVYYEWPDGTPFGTDPGEIDRAAR